MSKVLETLGPKFKGTLIEDPVLDPYFITADYGGGYTVHRKREDVRGTLRFSDECYPSTFTRCLEAIARNKVNMEAKEYDSLQEYIDTWKSVCAEIKNACKKNGVDNL